MLQQVLFPKAIKDNGAFCLIAYKILNGKYVPTCVLQNPSGYSEALLVQLWLQISKSSNRSILSDLTRILKSSLQALSPNC